jgi:antitoxin MazE
MRKQAAITTEIVRIGNSMGVRIPKAVREQAGLKKKVTLTVNGDSVVIRSQRKPREGWAEAFAAADTKGPDDALWPENMANAFDETEWEW